MAIKLNLGSGDHRYDGFTNVDLYDQTADIQADICDLPFENDSVDEAIAYQVIEHVPYNKSAEMFREIYRVLKPGAQLIIETPDIDYVCQAILTEGLQDKWMYNLVGEYHRPWDTGRYPDWDMHAGSVHRNPWNFERLNYIASGCGFVVERIDDMGQKVGKYEENLRCNLRKPA